MQPLAEHAPQTLPQDRRAPQRMCIVTRQSQDKDQLIRFVIDPEGCVIPDVAGKLPGRGMWVSAQKPVLHQAISKKIFSKAAKQPVMVMNDLAEQTERLLQARALDFLALANKAGSLSLSHEQVEKALQSGNVLALLMAEDASEREAGELKTSGLPVYQCFHREAMGVKLGREVTVYVAVHATAAGDALVKEISRYTGFIGNAAL